MRIIINKKIFIEVLSKIQGITNRKTNMTITENVLISASNDTIELSVTDLETHFKGIYPATVEDNGAVLINSKKLFEIIKEFPEENILIRQVENGWIKIGDKKIEYHIVGMDVDNFPAIPTFDGSCFYNIDSIQFKKMVERMIVITSPSEEKRATVNGILFEFFIKDEKTILRLVSTDGGRLSITDAVYDEILDFSDLKNIIIPKKGMGEVVKFLKNNGSVQIGFQGNYCIIKNNDEVIIIRLLEGAFLDYGTIINKENHHIINMDKQKFLMMLKRMSILSSDVYNGVIFDVQSDKLIISSTNPTIGESKEEMDIDFAGEHIQVAYNPKFYMDTINIMDDDIISLYVLDEKHPAFLEETTDKNYLSIIMPMKV